MASNLIKKGFKVKVETSAGDLAKCSDDAYLSSGAEIVNKNQVFDSGEYLILISC